MVNLDYLYNPDAAKPYVDKNFFVDKKLGFQVIEHGTILPHKDSMVNGKWTWGNGGIVDGNGEYIKSTHVNSSAGSSYTPPESIQHSSETVIYLGMFDITWGHVITDNIRRLWFLKSEFFNQFRNCSLVYIPRYGFNWNSNNKDFRRLMEILGIDVDKLQPITQPTQFDKIILPDESFYLEGYRKFTNEYRETIDRIRSFGLKHSTPISCKKLFFFHGKKGQFGEERLAEYFKSKGYQIVNPEKPRLTFDEELNLLINCESFASNLGSGSMNLLFLRDGTETILIPRTAYTIIDYQESVNRVHNLNVTYVDSTLSIFSEGMTIGRFLYIVSEPLKRFFGDKWDGYEEEDFKTFLQYVKHYLSVGFKFNPNIRMRYDKILSDFMAQLKQREDLITACDMPPNWEESLGFKSKA